MLKLFVLLSLTIVPVILLAAPHKMAVHHMDAASKKTPFAMGKTSKKKHKTLFRRGKRDKKPFSILGFEPFTVLGLALIVGGIFFVALLPLGILSLLFGFLRYKKVHPDTFKGDKKHTQIFVAGLILPVMAFLGIHAVGGRP